MKDTPRIVHEKQMEIILSKTPRERAMMGIDMMESVYRTVRKSIRQQHPEFNEKEITAAVFLRYYGHEFSDEEAKKITEHLKSV